MFSLRKLLASLLSLCLAFTLCAVPTYANSTVQTHTDDVQVKKVQKNNSEVYVSENDAYIVEAKYNEYKKKIDINVRDKKTGQFVTLEDIQSKNASNSVQPQFVPAIPLIYVIVEALITASLAVGAATLTVVAADQIVTAIKERFKEENPTVIYRLGSGTGQNLTPRERDLTGLSYTTVKPATGPYTATSIQAVNATGKLVAIQDGPTHVSVRPVDGFRMREWINTRPHATENPHEFTRILLAISFKVR